VNDPYYGYFWMSSDEADLLRYALSLLDDNRGGLYARLVVWRDQRIQAAD
jgi:hypothetical protein